MVPPVSITYTTGGNEPVTESFDFLVVACDPRLLPLAEKSELERDFCESLKSYTFGTSLIDAIRPNCPQYEIGSSELRSIPNYAIRFNPKPLNDMDADVYAYRDEVYAHHNREGKREPSADPEKRTWVTMYQILDKPLLGADEEEMQRYFDQKREYLLDAGNSWSDVKKNPNPTGGPVVKKYLVDYFPHFNAWQLELHLPWKIRDGQGFNHTMFVSSFTSFESVLHCYLYQKNIMKEGSATRKRFPEDKNARIAVIGAGPSGILFASQQLVKNGYLNFQVFEKESRFGGKSCTYHQPTPSDEEFLVPCELGTCYLSLSYYPMFDLFTEYGAGQIVGLSGSTHSVIDEQHAKTMQEKQSGIEFCEWMKRSNKSIPGNWPLLEDIEFVFQVVRYVVLHNMTMGMTPEDAIPGTPPHEEFVKENIAKLAEEVSKKGGRKHSGRIDAKVAVQHMLDEMNEVDHVNTGIRILLKMVVSLVKGSISESEIIEASNSVLHMPFEKFLNEHGMKELVIPLIYGYQVHGYGSIDRIPAYYGMVWITPIVMASFILEGEKETIGENKWTTTNLTSKGWQTLWEKMVEKDIGEKLSLGVTITNISRVS